jgi:hypothetical protein
VADLNDILTGLRAEIVKTVRQITVKERGDGECSFHYHNTGKGPAPIGRTRLFTVVLSDVESKWCGAGVQRYDTKWAVRVGYPATDWEIAQASDYDQLRVAFNAGGAGSSTTGVGFRHVPLSGYATEKTEEWCWCTFPIHAVVETA